MTTVPTRQCASTSLSWRARNLVGLAAAALLACSTATAPDEVAGPVGVVWVSDSYAGGQRVLDSTVVDSATGRWTVTNCGPVPAAAPICRPTDARTSSGTVDTTFRRLLSERATRADFLALNADYPLVGVTPPDLHVQSLRVTQNGRAKNVTWRSGSAAPVVLGSFVCLLQQSLGYLILCAN